MKLFTRTTRTTKTEEGVQQANISVFVYDSLEIAHGYFKEFMSEEQWLSQIETGEGFYYVEGNGYDNILFLETRKVPNNT